MNILFPTDFSSNAQKGLEYATNLVKSLGGTLHILTSYANPRPTGSFVSFADILKKDAENDLNNLVKENQPKLDQNIITHVAQSEPDNAIFNYAHNNNIDLIIIPTKGMSDIENMFLGSVAKKVVEGAEIPVLVVPSGTEKFNARHSKLLFAIDSKIVKQTFGTDLVRKLAKTLDSKIKFVHVNDESEPLTRETIQSIHNVFGDYYEDLVLLEGNVPSEIIVEYAFETEYDIVIMVKRKKSFFEKLLTTSQSYKGAGITHVPLLVIKE
jgi:nucleotide-binding universal stress UspA family protein